MTSPLLTLLYFSAFFAVLISEKLPDDRKKCEYRTILIESNHVQEKVYRFPIPEDEMIQNIFHEECENGPRKYRPKRRTTKPSSPLFHGLYEEEKYKGAMEDPDTFQITIRSLIRDKTVEPPLVNELIKYLNHTDSNLLIAQNVFYAQCIGQRADPEKIIKIRFLLMQPDELRIWRCEDVGRMANGSYEFYNLSPAWMVEDDEGNTYKINLHKCHENKFNSTFCHVKDVNDVKVWYNATCSVNNVNSCQLTTVQPQTNRASYIRKLPGGVAIYGTFKSQTRYTGISQNGFNINTPALYFFGFNKTDTIIL